MIVLIDEWMTSHDKTLATLQINTRWFLGTYSYWLVEPVDVIDESLWWMTVDRRQLNAN